MEADERSLQARPTPEAYVFQGRLHLSLGAREAARSSFEQALELRPDDAAARKELLGLQHP